MLEKQCRKCGRTCPMTEFYKHARMPDGHLNKCKPCAIRDVRENARKNPERLLAYEKARAMLPHRVEARKKYQETLRGKEALRRKNKKHWAMFPMKKVANTAIGNAIRDGRMSKASCEVCGNSKAQAHHDDYSKPLDVRWLCTTHHREWHKHNKAKYPTEAPE